MKTIHNLLALGTLVLALSLQPRALAQGTAFTYQGRLNDAGGPANGIYDLRFTLYDAAAGGSQVGGVLTNCANSITGGLFTATLDFGSGIFTGAPRWLEISVRTNGVGVFTGLMPRQPLTPVPYAVFSAASGSVSNSVITAGSGSGNAIMDLSGKGTNTTLFGVTNYFASDAPGNTNGPMVYYRKPGPNGLSNLSMDVTVGRAARFTLGVSDTPGDLAYGGIEWQIDHDNVLAPTPQTEEIVVTSTRHIALLPGTGYTGSGHLQIGSYSHLGGYAGAPNSGANVRLYMVDQGPVFNDQYPTNFSGAISFQTSEMQGANYVPHYPSIFAYSMRTNVPGRWAMMFTSEIYPTVNGDVWDPNSAKPNRVFEITSGDITNALFFKPINYPTNLGTAAIDCSIPVSDLPTAGVNITFTAPVNFDTTAKQYEHVYQIITNSGAAITLTAPSDAKLMGTLSVTRMCQVEWWIKIGQYTNGVVTQWF